MASKKSCYFTDQAEAVLGLDLDSFSGRMNNVIIRYGEIMRQECPAFTVSEWSAICDALNSCWLQAEGPGTDPARFIWAEIADADRLDGLGVKWGIDAAGLASRIQAMRYSEQCAIVDVVARFWKSSELNILETGELLRKVGARMKP